MTYKSKKLTICLLFIVCLFATAVPVLAQSKFGLEYATALSLGTRDLRATAMQMVNILLGFLGVVFIGVLLYGGYLYMTSRGAADKVERAKKVLINGAIGLAIILASYAIAFFVINALMNATGGGGGGVCNNDLNCVSPPENCANCPGDCGPCPPPPIGANFAVSWVDPKDWETDVSLCDSIQMKFNNQIDPETIENLPAPWGGSFTVDAATMKGNVNLWVEVQGGLLAGAGCVTNNQCASGVCSGTCQGNIVSGEITIWSTVPTSPEFNRGLIFNNTDDFEKNTTYKVTIKSDEFAPNGLENTDGYRLARGDYTWTFTTGDTADTLPPKVLNVFPVDGKIDVCLATTVTTIFNEPMDVSSLLSTDGADPMNPDSINSIYINPPISGFNKSVSGPTTLIAKPKSLLSDTTIYTPVLDGDVIRDSCGNYLDGDGDGVAESSPIDDYAPPPVAVAPDWSFTTGTTAKCTPEITSIVPPAGYYNDESAADADLLTINGNYFTIAGSLFFNNNVEAVSAGTSYCIDPVADPNYVPSEECIVAWNDNQIQVRIPAKNGASNGAISGNIFIEVGVGNISNAMPFTVASPHIDSIWPKEGGIDQFVTMSGSGFGATKGINDHVYFRRDDVIPLDGKLDLLNPAETIEANYPCGGSIGWTDNQIIISVPDNVNFDDGEDWFIQVVRDEAINNYWGNLGNFKFKNIVPGPGLCSAENQEAGPYSGLAEGILDDTIKFSGVRFQDVNPPPEQEVNFGNYISFISAKSIGGWTYGPPADTVNGDVPNIAEGKVGVYLKIDGKNSNTVNFIVHPTTAGPKINYFEPISGAVGEYVTVYGNNFSTWDGGLVCNVEFSDGVGGWKDGDFNFPASCGNNFWNDTQIVVKVPAGAATGNIKVTTRDSLSDDTSDLSPSDFTINPGPAGPGICGINPKAGPVGTSVDVFGERFTGFDDVIFFNNKSALSYNPIDDENITSAIVPNNTTPVNPDDDAVSGPIIIVDDKNSDSDYNDVGEKSNGYNFSVFDCREAKKGCADIGYPGYECCYDGSCMDPAGGGCDNPSEATYSWNFSTGAYTTCSGYSMDQCLASNNCPNSPGQCSPTSAQTGVDIGNNCGDNYCNTSFPAVCASTCAFSNNRCVSGTVTCDIAKDANLIVLGLSGIARCNNVGGNNYWQTDVPCQSGTYLDTNGKCTLGSVGDPEDCNPNCADGFSCMDLGGTSTDDICAKSNICPSGSACDLSGVEADGYNACKRDIPGKCECCCRVGYSDTDCCAGLTCENDACGTDDAVYTYGYCKGCAVWDNMPPWTFFRTLSDDKCGCINSNRVCIADELLAPPPGHDIGFCGDCGDINIFTITYDSDGDSLIVFPDDVRHECNSHSGVCCWGSITNTCYTCDSLEVVEEDCILPGDLASPSPQKDKTDVCLDSGVYIKFNLELDPLTLAAGVEVYKCTVGGKSCTTAVAVAGVPSLLPPPASNELIFTPTINFDADTWYKVIINKNLKDLNGLNLENNYQWLFKTKDTTEPCEIETIQVSPENAVITTAFTNQAYSALLIADCTVLDPLSYNWDWQSSNTDIATIINTINPSTTATAQDKDGSTKIIASVPAESKQGETTLFVFLESPKVVKWEPVCKEACLNASMRAEFNIAMLPSTLNLANIELYRWYCGNGEIEVGEDCDDGNAFSGDGCSGVATTTICNAIFAEEECENKNIDCFWDGAVCQNFSSALSQADCQDANGYWNGATCDNNKGCLNEGSNGSTSICGNGTVESGEECDGNPLPQGCDTTTCLHTGSVASLSTCGDGNITEGEDCDGDPFPAGCSANCLNEGTNNFINVPLGTISPNIGNTIIDINLLVGTYFDPNTNYRVFLSDEIRSNSSQKQLTELNWDFNKDSENDSFSWSFKTKNNFCNPDTVKVDPAQKIIYSINATQDYEASTYGSPDSCNPLGQKLNPYSYNWSWKSVNESVATITEGNNWPGCGNEKIEVGEDCDDGNNLSGDGCSSNLCLNEGTTTDMGLISHWEFNEGSDVFAYDSAGVNDGNIINGPLWTTGKFGGAIDFDGTNDHVDVGDVFAVSQTELTVSAWVFVDKFNNIVGGESTPIVSNWNSWAPGNQKGFLLRTFFDFGTNTMNWEFVVCDNNASYTASYDTLSFNDFNTKYAGQWLHIVGTYKPGANNLKFYINGRNEGNVAGPVNMTPNIASSVWIGRTGIDPNYFNGIIDDVRIYDKALTGAQVQGIMSQKNYLCDNGVIDFGEDCDGDPFPAGCDINTCLHTGSMGVCGNGIIETGEDCDDGNAANLDGCSSVCLNEGTQIDSYIDFYQTATTKSPGKTDIEASVNYCGDAPTTTCGVALPPCPTGLCKQTPGNGELEVVCGFSNDDFCSQGVCSGGFCTNNSSIACALPSNCDLVAIANTTCDFAGSNHICSIATWGGTCSVSEDLCYSASDCPNPEICQPNADCNYCKNNTSFECRTANNLIPGPGNSDCQLGVGYDSCCYSRPIVQSESPDPKYFNPLLNPPALNCNNNFTPLDNTDDYCSAFAAGVAGCQTYTCKDTNADLIPDTCSAYGTCFNGVVYANPNIYCLNNNDCPQDTFPSCNKSCADDSDCNDIVCGACRNAQINITFDKVMDPASFISEGVCSNNSSQKCNQDSNCSGGVCLKNIRFGVKYDDAAINQKNCPSGYYAENDLVYKKPKGFIAKLVAKIKIWFNKLLGQKETVAAEYWCAIPGIVTSFNNNNRTTAVFTPQGLKDNLFEDGVTYRVTVKHGVKRTEGVSMGKDDSSDFQYEFTAGDTECQVEAVDVYVGD